MSWNLPDGCTPAMIDALDVDDEAFDDAVDEISDRISYEADKHGIGIDFDLIADYGTLDDDDVRDQILEAIRTCAQPERDEWIKDIVYESAAEGNLDVDRFIEDKREY